MFNMHINLKSLRLPATKIWKSAQNVKKKLCWFGVIRGHSKSSAMSPFDITSLWCAAPKGCNVRWDIRAAVCCQTKPRPHTCICWTRYCAAVNLCFSPQDGVVDFEISMLSAIQSVLPNASVHCCRFHLGQAWWRHMNRFSRQRMFPWIACHNRQESLKTENRTVTMLVYSIDFIPFGLFSCVFIHFCREFLYITKMRFHNQ